MKRRMTAQERTELRDQLEQDIRAGRLYIHEAARQMRQLTGKTQNEFACMVGLAARTYIDFERGVGNPTIETLAKIGALFGYAVKFGPYETLHDSGEAIREKPKACRGLPRRLKGRGREHLAAS